MSSAGFSPEDELDALRVRRVAAERRAANRLRSYLLIGGIIAAGLLVQVVMMLLHK